MSRLADPVYLAVKSAVASSCAVALAHALSVPDAISSGFVAIVCVTPTAYGGLRRGLEQLVSALVAWAATAAMLALWPFTLHGYGAAGVVLGSMGATVWLCHRFTMTGGYLVAGFTALYLVLMPFHSLGEAVRVRIEAVLLGIVASTVVNLAVSAVSAHRIRERRVRLALEALAASLDLTARACADPARRAAADDGWPSVFESLAELRDDLAAQSREVLLPQRRAVRERAREALRMADALGDAAHLGRHVTLLLEGSTQRYEELEGPLLALARALEQRAPCTDALTAVRAAAAGLDDAAMATALRRMADAVARSGLAEQSPGVDDERASAPVHRAGGEGAHERGGQQRVGEHRVGEGAT